MFLPVTWPRLDELTMVRCNRLYACNGVSFEVGGHRYEVFFPPHTASDYLPGVMLSFSAADRGFNVEMERLPFRGAVSELLGDVSLQALPDDLAAAVLMEVCAQPLSRLALHMGESVQLTAYEDQKALPRLSSLDGSVVPFCLLGNGERINGRLFFNAVHWPMLLTLLEQHRVPYNGGWNHLPIPLRLIAGVTHLDTIQVNGLVPGDLVVLDLAFSGENPGLLLPRQQLWRLSGDQQKILEEPMEMPQLFHRDQETAMANPILELVFEVGRANITLQELNALEQGSVLPCGVNLEQGARMMVNGLHVGRGELVRLGDQLAVRITDLDKKRREPRPLEEP